MEAYNMILNSFDKIFNMLDNYDKFKNQILYDISIYDQEDILNANNIRFTVDECIDYNKYDMYNKFSSCIHFPRAIMLF